MAFPPSGAFGSFLGGFNDESEGVRQRNERDAQSKQARDQKVFETLANSDDPEIRAAAVTGLLTGNHPAKGMDKWFGKVQDHPIHDTIRSLVADGHQPFMDPAKRHSTELTNDLDAKITAIQDPKHGLSPTDQRRATLGMFGAPPPRPLPLQVGNIHRKDGSVVAGFFDPAEGAMYDANYQPIEDAVRFERSSGAGGTGASGHTTKVVKDPASKTGYSYVRFDDQMKEIGRQTDAPAPGTGQPSFDFLQTPGGVVAGNKHTGTNGAAPGGEGVNRPAAPGADLNALREVETSILRLHPQPKPIFTGGQIAPEKLAKWRTEVDAEAQHYGYDDFEALQGAIGSAGQGVSDVTPPPQVPPGLGAKPVPKGPPSTKDKANTGKGKIDVKAILGELAKGRQPAAPAGRGAPVPAP